MIYIILRERLGNVLFQMAVAASIAKKLNCEFRILTHPLRHTLPSNIEYYLQLWGMNDKCVDSYPSECKVINTSKQAESIKTDELPVVMNGYFQSISLIDPSIALQLFRPTASKESALKEQFPDIDFNHTAAIHIRRGDYLALPNFHPVCSLQYYKNGIQSLSKQGVKHFLLFSDDSKWCKKHFRGPEYSFSSSEEPLEDIILQSLCAHNIISNSSFSWWGAFLNPSPTKRVIYPNVWFGISYSNRFPTELIPNEWEMQPSVPPVSTRLLALIHHLFFVLKRWIKLSIKH